MPHDVTDTLDGLVSRSAFAPTFPMPERVTDGLLAGRDPYYGGTGRIVGTTKVDAIPTPLPVSRRVRLIHEQTGVCIRETWSRASDGEYRFEFVALDVRWTVLSYDHTETNRAVTADRLYAEPMP